MDFKQKKGDKALILKRCCMRVKCFVGKAYLKLTFVWSRQQNFFCTKNICFLEKRLLLLQKQMLVLIQLLLRYVIDTSTAFSIMLDLQLHILQLYLSFQY